MSRMVKLSKAQRRALEFTQDHTLIRSYGMRGNAGWSGGKRDAPKVSVTTADILIRAGLLQKHPTIKRHWGDYYIISDAGRTALEAKE